MSITVAAQSKATGFNRHHKAPSAFSLAIISTYLIIWKECFSF